MPLTLAPDNSPNECECCSTTAAQLKAEGKKLTKSRVSSIDMWMCPNCYQKEVAAEESRNNSEAQNRRISEMNSAMARNRAQVETIKLSEELFNADTVAILDLKKEIDSDASIPADKK